MSDNVAVVNVNHIQTRQPQALQAVFNTAAHTGRRKVPDLVVGQHIHIAVLFA